MKLTGKCKADFEKWFRTNVPLVDINIFNNRTTPKSMQFGIYCDFFNSVGIEIDIRFIRGLYLYERVVYFRNRKEDTTLYNKLHATHQEAREQAILKANEIYNK